jgi:pyrimidine-nucleoside phosphorylase
MRPVDIIRKKRDGQSLTHAEVWTFVKAAADGHWPDYQLSALLMAICIRGMSTDETAWLTRAMADSGICLNLSDLPGPAIDKHSTGGVGDKTSLILAPLAAACGVYVPMMSGRGLGHTGGTLDKLESIPGFRVHLTLDEFHQVLRKVGVAMMGQTADVAPADKKLYALRDVTGTVESIPLITASILSKKLAEGAKGLVMDVKVGRGAFMKDEPSARALAKSIVVNGNSNRLKTEALLTAMDTPLGCAVGNSLEVIECIETLKGHGPKDLEELSVELAARMVLMGKKVADLDAARQMIRNALTSGQGLEKFRDILQAQGGNPKIIDDYRLLPTAPSCTTFNADRSGYVAQMDAERIGVASMLLGAGRERADHDVDPAVGLVLLKKPGDKVKTGEPVIEVHYRGDGKLPTVMNMLKESCVIDERPPTMMPLIMDVIV